MTTESKITKAADAIAESVGVTLLTFREQLGAKYELTQQQLAVAVTISLMQLLAAAVAGITVGPDATEAELVDAVKATVCRIQPAIAGALEVK